MRRKWQCKGKVKGNLLGDVVERLNEHTMHCQIKTCKAVWLRIQMKDQADRTRDAPQQTLVDALANASETAAINLSRIESLRQNICSQRQVMQLNQ